MYFRRKTSGGRTYLQIVESRREGDRVRQQVIATLGRIDELDTLACAHRISRCRPAPRAIRTSASPDISHHQSAAHDLMGQIGLRV